MSSLNLNSQISLKSLHDILMHTGNLTVRSALNTLALEQEYAPIDPASCLKEYERLVQDVEQFTEFFSTVRGYDDPDHIEAALQRERHRQHRQTHQRAMRRGCA